VEELLQGVHSHPSRIKIEGSLSTRSVTEYFDSKAQGGVAEVVHREAKSMEEYLLQGVHRLKFG
jgi:hypothetical protein